MLQQVSKRIAVTTARRGVFCMKGSTRTVAYKSRRPTPVLASASSEKVVEEDPGKKDEPIALSPKFTSFDENCVNAVTLTGVVADEPRVIEFGEGSDKGSLVALQLAVRQRGRRDIFYDYFRLTFFGFNSAQVREFVPKGSKIIVQGEMRTYQGNTQVSVKDFAKIKDDTWPYKEEAPDYNFQQTENRQFSNIPRSERKIMRPFLMKSEIAVHEDYVNGKTIEEIMRERNYKKSTVLSYLAAAAFHGRPVDFPFLARNCLLGPKGSIYMEMDVVSTAIKTIADRKKVENLVDIPAAETRDLLRNHNEGKIFKTQEQVINSVTYSQMSTVMAMMKSGMTEKDWNAFKVVDPQGKHPGGDTPAKSAPY